MAPLINAEHLRVTRGLKTLLDDVSLGVNTGECIGVVGLNGGGKSTLLKILTGAEEPDSGRISHARDLRLATVDQRAAGDDTTVIDTIVAGQAAHEWAADPKVRNILAGLELTTILDVPTAQISGGQLRRTMLARALVQDVDLLVLDEPTNHLDIEGIQWLAQHLITRNCALVIVTHDRWFLDTVATRTWEVHDGAVDAYDGGYNDWIFARAERQRQADAMEARRQNLARKELAWLRRGAPARTSKPRYRIEAAEALIKNVPAPRETVELMAFSRQRQGKIVVDLVDATIATPDGDTLLDAVTWRLGPGERIGLVGVNGSGKTTLLRTLAGDFPLREGSRREGKTLRLGWLRQELDDIPEDRTVLESVKDVAEYVTIGREEMSASQVAERLGFSPKQQRQPVKDLSGGERRRLQLTRILMAEPNLLLLDEPTNDLDIDTLQELESLLDGWPGTLVVISHDRYLIERVCDMTYALLGDGKLTHLPGGIDQYMELRRQRGASRADWAAVGQAAGSVAPESEAQAPVVSAAQAHRISKEMNSLDRKIQKLAATEQALHEQMAQLSADVESLDTQKLAQLAAEVESVAASREELELQWLELGEQMEGGNS